MRGIEFITGHMVSNTAYTVERHLFHLSGWHAQCTYHIRGRNLHSKIPFFAKGKGNVVDVLLSDPDSTELINFNAVNANGDTGFHLACREGNKIIVELLLLNSKPRGIKLNSINNDGQTGLNLALSTIDQETCEVIQAEQLWWKNNSQWNLSNLIYQIISIIL